MVLGTLSSSVDPAAERMAIDSALEAGVSLIVVNVVELPPCPRALALGGLAAIAFPHEEEYAAVRATAERAAKLGLSVEHLRVSSPRPGRALGARSPTSAGPGCSSRLASAYSGAGWMRALAGTSSRACPARVTTGAR